MLSEPFQVTLQVVKVFDYLGIPYLVGGSLASTVHGVLRATMDADIVADIHQDQVGELVNLLKDSFYIDPDMVCNAIQENSSFNIIHLETMFKVDIFLLKQRPFDQNQMQRRILQSIGDAPDHVYFSTAEDIVLAKLEWFRKGGETSDRQWRDIIGVLRLYADRIDLKDMREWAKNLRIIDLLEKAFREIGLS